MKKSQRFLLFFVINYQLVIGIKSSSRGCFIEDYRHNYVITKQKVFDADNETWIYLREGGVNLVGVEIINNPYITYSMNNSHERIFKLGLLQFDEKTEITRGNTFYYNFTMILNCSDESVVTMDFKVPVVDSNNHKPFFEKPNYTYNLLSPFAADFKRQQILNPIVATDYDVTNTELEFSIDENDYFDIIYNGIVPNTLNKKHFALLTPKFSGKILKKKIKFNITVTDVGFPPLKNVATLIVTPPSSTTTSSFI